MRPTKPIILFQDDHIIAINKPAGMLSVPDRFDLEIPNLKLWLSLKYPTVLPVHRLDKQTSGIMLFALSEEAHQNLNTQFERRQIEKTYYAITRFQPSGNSTEIGIDKHPKKPGRMICHAKGKPSKTSWTILESFENFHFLEVKPVTGRTHQIRVHLQYAGAPLAIDSVYGDKKGIFLSEILRRPIRLKKDEVERPLMNRLALHAGGIQFSHPHSKEKVKLEAVLPKDFKAVLNQLRKNQPEASN